jgi:hypothetical protein
VAEALQVASAHAPLLIVCETSGQVDAAAALRDDSLLAPPLPGSSLDLP